ncbi:MAG: squalene synthase HpnC [Gammaproteobacteria bacterium]|nr:squalene synthase HpnC [Gammaproteobacteria bacterium]MDH5659433.1 squalene synthase HpnC [Gammaproteobacteria bacterium]
MNKETLQNAYAECLLMAQSHYENFPVASRLLPKHLRMPIAVIYAFARRADDFADEGDLSNEERISALTDFGHKLDLIEQNKEVDDATFIALADVIKQHDLPISLFHDLLTAFKMDVTKARYANFGEVIEYCRYSANPVGRLLLHLNKATSPQNLGYSDAICSALQLTNFLQDISQDLEESDRIYIPQDEMEQCGVTEDDIRNKVTNPASRKLIEFQIRRALKLMQSGAPLGKALKGRMGLELRMTIMGGSRILYKLNQQYDDVFSRPRLSKWDISWVIWKAIRAK